MNSISSTLRWILISIGVLALMVLVAGGFVVYEYTIIYPWLFYGVTSGVALISGVVLAPYWEKLTHISNRWINYIIHTVVCWLIFSSGWLIINFISADFDSLSESQAIVTRKYTSTRYKSVRNGRRGYTRGAPYKVYDIVLEKKGVGKWDMKIPKHNYDLFSKGDTAIVRIARGHLGLTVLNPAEIRPLHPSKKKIRKGRCRFFGTYDNKERIKR